MHPLIHDAAAQTVARWTGPYGILVVPLLFERSGGLERHRAAHSRRAIVPKTCRSSAPWHAVESTPRTCARSWRRSSLAPIAWLAPTTSSTTRGRRRRSDPRSPSSTVSTGRSPARRRAIRTRPAARARRLRAESRFDEAIVPQDLIRYEHPLNERVRTLMRLEDLYSARDLLLAAQRRPRPPRRATALFEITDVAARADLKTDILQELERQKQMLGSLRSNPAIDTNVLDPLLADIDASARAARADGQGRRTPARQRVADGDQAAHGDSRRRLRVRPARLPLVAAIRIRARGRPTSRRGSSRSRRSARARRSSCGCCATTAARAGRSRITACSS